MRRISFKSGGILNHRKDRRLSLLQLTLEADDVEYDSLDWSLGGIRIDGVLPKRNIDSSLMIKVSGERKGQKLSIEVMATIVRLDTDDNETALRFVDLTAEDLDVLEALITGRRIASLQRA
jgi:hypothetical protein